MMQSSYLTVSALTQQVKSAVEVHFGTVWVTGQISGMTRHSSGHIYLTLKDSGAVLPAVVWRSSASRVKFTLTNGLEVVCRGHIDVYVPHGKYQLVIENIEPVGIGALELAFRQLHGKLSAEGLFDPLRKKPLPKSIRRIAVITSDTGAALQDFLRIVQRRTKLLDVLLVPVSVQGEKAAAEIAEAIQRVNVLPLVDCIAVIRGGGSKEDLWAFNEEVLVRSIATSVLPIVSGIGHEIDTSLCDLAADLRCATPSEVAEKITIEDDTYREYLFSAAQTMRQSVVRYWEKLTEQLAALERHPILQRPERLLEDRRRQVDGHEERMNELLDRKLTFTQNSCSRYAAELEALSPLAVLARGYTLTQTAAGKRIQSTREVNSGETLITILADGKIKSIVKEREYG